MKKLTILLSGYKAAVIIVILLLISCGLAGCSPGQSATATPTPTIPPEKLAEYRETFNIVWQTINETYFDPDFNGVDWDAMYDEYLPKISAAENEEAFYMLVNEMCFQINASHMALLPPGSADQIEPILSARGSVGLDVRFIDEQVVITSVEAGSAANRAGLQTGFIILSVDGVSVENEEEWITLWLPPRNERRRQGQILSAILTKFYGEPGQSITVSYLDAQNQEHEATLVMEARKEEPFTAQDLPAMYIGFEARRLEGNIAYIQLDGFLPPVLDGVLGAIQEMGDAPAMIIDVRGNPGGFYYVRKAIASQFFRERTLLWRYITRPGLELPGFEREGYTDPPDEPYLGPVAVLVDILSGSSSEEFSGMMKANQRATVVGMRTAGSVLVGDIKVLPNGATFLYPFAQTRTADGAVLEDHGVIPDITVPLDRDDLRNGIDTQLEAAVRYLLSESNY